MRRNRASVGVARKRGFRWNGGDLLFRSLLEDVPAYDQLEVNMGRVTE